MMWMCCFTHQCVKHTFVICPFLQKESFQIGQPAWLTRVFVEIFVDFFLRSRVLLACGCLFLHSQDVFFFRKLEFVLRIGHLCRKMKTKSFASLRWLSIHYIYIFVANWFCWLWIFDGSGNVTKTLLFVNIVRFVFLQCPSPSWTPNLVWELPIANQSNSREICNPH